MPAGGTRLVQYSASLYEFIGAGIDKVSIVSSALLATISLFYVFAIGSYLSLTVYYFLLRFTYVKSFNDYLVGRYFDSVIISALTVAWLVLSLNGRAARLSISSVVGIALVVSIVADLPGLRTFIELLTLPLVLFFVFYQKRKRRYQHREIVRYFCRSLTLNYLTIIAVILGIFSVLISVSVISGLQSFSVENIFTTKRFPVENYGYEIFILFSTISPLLLIVIFFSLPVKLVIKTIYHSIVRFNKRRRLQSELRQPEMPIKNKYRILCLSLFILFSISLAVIPQISTVNKDNQQIGSDSETYVQWVNELKQADSLQEFLKTAFVDLFRGDRPLTHIFLFLVTTAIDAPALDTVEYVPVILGPALVLVIYFLTRELTSNELTSLFAASLTGLGYFQVSMGIYAGFYANWTALLFGYSSLIFFFRFLRSDGKVSLLIFLVLLMAVLFSHAYTWTVFTIVMGIFLVISLILNFYPRGKTILLLLAVLSSVIFDIIKTMLLPVGGIKATLKLAESNVGVKELGLVWETLVNATQLHYGGIFCNVVILGLVIYWLMRSNLRTDYNIFIIVFLIIGIPPLFLGDWVVQSRVYYNIPFQIPAAIGLTFLLTQKNSFRILLPIYVWLVAISVWTVSNFYKVIPS